MKTHRGIEGNDFSDCSVVFLYILATMAIKPNLQRVLGHTPPKAQMPKTVFGMPNPQLQ